VNGSLQRPTAPAEQPKRRRHVPLPAREFLTGPQVRAELGISRSTFLNWRKAELFPAPAPIPGQPKWRVSDVERFKNGGVRSFTAHLRAAKRSRVG
jgi:predicted DNA-binding transcriptional regulator AlpA